MAPQARRSRGHRRGPRTVTSRRLPARSSTARDEKRDEDMVRLNKFLADQGIASRRACDELITKGKVMVDGEPITELGTRINPFTQVVDVAGVLLKPEGMERRYYLLNKPAGVVCTNERNEMRPRAVDLITDPKKGRIYTVGRLDEDSTGLILCTNDGDFTQRIAHPRHGVSKTYAVRVYGNITDEAVQKVRHGVHLSEGRTAGARVVVLRRTAAGSNLEVTLREGKNREVRRTFARVGHKVLTLKRVRIGPLNDRGLKIGKWRPLSRDEVEALLRGSHATGTDAPFHPSQDMPSESEASEYGSYESAEPDRAPWRGSRTEAPLESKRSPSRGTRGARKREEPSAGPREGQRSGRPEWRSEGQRDARGSGKPESQSGSKPQGRRAASSAGLRERSDRRGASQSENPSTFRPTGAPRRSSSRRRRS